MKFSESWLREWVDPPIDSEKLMSQLTLAGLEIDSIEPIAGDLLIEVDLTPNRGDCLSVYGLAREVATLNRLAIKPLEVNSIGAKSENTFPVDIEAPHDCPRYVGRVINHLKTNIITPDWLKTRIEQSGIRSIHPVVDILNYVMLEVGQPMHAFDLASLKGALMVRHAKPEENITLLNGQTLVLNPKTLIIADKHQVLAIAGVMGGDTSGVKENTTDIFLESALFTPHLIAGKARLYGLHTDSSFRFERGVDPTLQVLAIERATALILEICGGEPGPIEDVKNEKMIPKPLNIPLRFDRIKKLLGYEIPKEEVKTILKFLGCSVEHFDEASLIWKVTPPAFRYDISSEIDLIEELVRIVGYDKVPSTLPQAQMNFIPTQRPVPAARVKRALVDFGYQEVITYSFVDESLQKQLFPEAEMLALLNPISADMGVMRVSLWPGLINAAKYNQYRQQPRQKLFEVGMRFRPHPSGLIQEDVVAGLLCGEQFPEHWDRPKGQFDFYDIKQPVESLWRLMGNKGELTYRPINLAACHPGQVAEVIWQGKAMGIVGRLHPQLEKALDITGPLFLFELDPSFFSFSCPMSFEIPSKFPEIRRDLALIVEHGIAADSLTNFVINSAGEILREVKIFDVYTGKGMDPGRKSVGLGLIFQHPSRTLIDSEIDTLLQSIITGVKKEFHAELRD